MSSSQRADRLLCCAIAYNASDAEARPLPTTFASTEDAVASFMNCLWVEAKQALRESIPPPADAYLHPVDIGSDEPGIVATKDAKGGVHRRRAPFPTVSYASRPRAPAVAFKAPPPVTLEEARGRAADLASKAAKETMQRAVKDIRSEQRSAQAAERREAKKRERESESKEERAERLAEQRRKREERKADKERLQSHSQEETSEGQERGEEEEEEGGQGREGTSARGGEPPGESDAPVVVVGVDDLLRQQAEGEPDAQSTLPTKARSARSKVQFFASPVPFDRHMGALEDAALSPELAAAVLRAEHTPNLRIVRGPPGTGKTRYLAHEVVPLFNGSRVLACAPTNVGTANLYQRILQVDASAALLMPLARIPPNTPVTNQDPHARIVCCTISGRAGTFLDAEKFDVVLIDEAAQCMEAWTWALLRPEVRHVVMAGDIHQLPALVSPEGEAAGYGRSMMERLLASAYPSTLLTEQRRMHPEIVSFPNRSVYEGLLTTSYVPHPSASDVRPYEVVHVDGECVPSGTSFANRVEAEAVRSIVSSLKTRFETVVVISPYQAQTRALLAMGLDDVHTVDSFQGQEADAVVLSVVRRSDIGFWADYRRLNVALTRAKHCMRVVGSSTSWTGLLKDLRCDAEQRGCLVELDISP